MEMSTIFPIPNTASTENSTWLSNRNFSVDRPMSVTNTTHVIASSVICVSNSHRRYQNTHNSRHYIVSSHPYKSLLNYPNIVLTNVENKNIHSLLTWDVCVWQLFWSNAMFVVKWHYVAALFHKCTVQCGAPLNNELKCWRAPLE